MAFLNPAPGASTEQVTMPETEPETRTDVDPKAAAAWRIAFEHAVGSLSLMLSLLSITSRLGPSVPNLLHLKADIARLFFTFPVVCSGSFRQMIRQGDERALIVLFHFHRATRILLSDPETWWAHERSRVMEDLVGKELRSRGLDTCPWKEVSP